MDNTIPTVIDALGRIPSPNDGNPPPGAAPIDVDPPKRRPGRPRGSGKKSAEISQHGTPVPGPPKIKRPVGRPRKDGFPAGSVGPRRSNRTSKGAADSSSSSAGPASVFPYSSVSPTFVILKHLIIYVFSFSFSFLSSFFFFLPKKINFFSFYFYFMYTFFFLLPKKINFFSRIDSI
jgi:hypothetical protein